MVVFSHAVESILTSDLLTLGSNEDDMSVYIST